MLKILKLIKRANLQLIAHRSEYYKNGFYAPLPPKKPILMYKMLIKGRFMSCDRMSTFKSLEYFLLGIFRQLLGSEAINTARYKMYIDYINVSKFKLVFSQILH